MKRNGNDGNDKDFYRALDTFNDSCRYTAQDNPGLTGKLLGDSGLVFSSFFFCCFWSLESLEDFFHV